MSSRVVFNIGVCLLSGLFLFFGFQTANIELSREASGMIHGKVVRKHIFGLYRVKHEIDNVIGARLGVKSIIGPYRSSTHAMYIVNENSELQVLPFNNFGYKAFDNSVNNINVFVNDKTKIEYADKINMNNFLGWGGLFFILLAVSVDPWNKFNMKRLEKAALKKRYPSI
jgi:hypothetical protein